MAQLLWKTVPQLLKNWNTESPYDPAVPQGGIEPRALKTCSHRNSRTNVCSNIRHNTVVKDGTKTNAHHWMTDRQNVAYPYKERKEARTCATPWMNLENIMFSGRSWSQTTYNTLLFTQNVQNGQMCRDKVDLWLLGSQQGKRGRGWQWAWGFLWGWWKCAGTRSWW